MLKVSRKPDGDPEIFVSIQGEGANTGRPAVFLRLGLCNLRCTWCDTKYTWDWSAYNPQQHIVEMPVGDVERAVLGHRRRYVVVTGGEPLLQQDRLAPLFEFLKNSQFFIEVETNGTISPEKRLLASVDHWSVSPKLANSGNPRSSREIPDCYRAFAGTGSSHFKYVVQGEDDLSEVRDLVRAYDLLPERVILMPEAQNRQDLMSRSRWLAEICKDRGYMFSTRLHVLLWGNERGR